MRGTHPQPPKLGFTRPEDECEMVWAGGSSVGSRKKATGVRPWLFLDATGQAQFLQAGKHTIMHRTGLPARNLRVLDPLLSYPSTMLGRERAIVINLEHIKAIITAHEVLLLNSQDPTVSPFVEELQRHILRHHHATKSQEGGVNADGTDQTEWYGLEEPQSRSNSPRQHSGGFPPRKDEKNKGDGKQALDNQGGLKVLPFEFIALEACLQAACRCLDREASTLEQEAHPAVEKLTSKISSGNLENVRQIKSRLVAITGRVQKVRDELEHLLDDDEDMAEMYLTDKIAEQNHEKSSQSSQDGTDDDDDHLLLEMDDRIPTEISLEGNASSTNYEGENPKEQPYGAPNVIGRDNHGSQRSATHSAVNKHLDVVELERLLEPYFIQIDGTLNKLSTLKEYVDDTEDYINITLDDKQNNLLKMRIILITITLMFNLSVLVTGFFSMNIDIALFLKDDATKQFVWVGAGSTAVCILMGLLLIAWIKHKMFLQ